MSETPVKVLTADQVNVTHDMTAFYIPTPVITAEEAEFICMELEDLEVGVIYIGPDDEVWFEQKADEHIFVILTNKKTLTSDEYLARINKALSDLANIDRLLEEI